MSKMAEEVKAPPLPEEQPEEGLPQKLSSILEGDVTVHAKEESVSQRDEDYVYVYRGTAFNQEELFRFSAREDVKQVLIAGPHSSGKTTLIVMLYCLFLEGRNHALRFAGSMTLEGFKDRSEKVFLSSGEADPTVDRTSLSEQNRYLHLALMDKDRRKSNLILADISGELFTPDYMEELSELYGDCENVIVTMDGAKLQSFEKRQHEVMQTIILLKELIGSGIITKRSKLQIICTKSDLIEKGEDSEKTIEFLKNRQEGIRQNYAAEVSSLEFQRISALRLDSLETQEKLEQIMLKCMEGGTREIATPFEEPDLHRYFDKFKFKVRR